MQLRENGCDVAKTRVSKYLRVGFIVSSRHILYSYIYSSRLHRRLA